MPSDQILSGQVVNTSTDDLYVDARGIAVVDGGGHRFGTAARFLSAFVHPLYAPFQFHTFGGPSELQRLGIFVRIEPGQRLPLTVSWRNTSSDDQPTQVDLGSEKLPVPS